MLLLQGYLAAVTVSSELSTHTAQGPGAGHSRAHVLTGSKGTTCRFEASSRPGFPFIENHRGTSDSERDRMRFSDLLSPLILVGSSGKVGTGWRRGGKGALVNNLPCSEKTPCAPCLPTILCNGTPT